MHILSFLDQTVAVNVLQDLARMSTSYEKPSGSHHSHTKICKTRTWPKQKRSAPSIRSSPLQLGVQGIAVMRPHSADKCSQCSSSATGSSYRHVLKYASSSNALLRIYLINAL